MGTTTCFRQLVGPAAKRGRVFDVGSIPRQEENSRTNRMVS